MNPYRDNPDYPNCGPNALWAVCLPEPYTEVDADNDGYIVSGGDCDDNNPNVRPGAKEICNNIDDNCANGVDEEPAANQSCDDGIACTENYCAATDHVCSLFYIHEHFDDQDPCTTDFCTLRGCEPFLKMLTLAALLMFFAAEVIAMTVILILSHWLKNFATTLMTTAMTKLTRIGKLALLQALVCRALFVRVSVARKASLPVPPIGHGAVYSPAPSPLSQEICDGMDNNCNSQIDENQDTDLSCNDNNNFTVDSYALGTCQNAICDQDNDGHGDDLCGGDDCNDLDSTIWFYTFSLVRLTNASGQSALPVVVLAESEFGIAWQDDRDGNQEIYFARVDAALQKVGSNARVTNAPGSPTEPTIVWTGSEFGLGLTLVQAVVQIFILLTLTEKAWKSAMTFG